MRAKHLVLAAALVASQSPARADEGSGAPGDRFASAGFLDARPTVLVRYEPEGARQETEDVRQPVLDLEHGRGWRFGRAVYLGRRPGDLGGFGVKWRAGANELALTRKGIGWRRRF